MEKLKHLPRKRYQLCTFSKVWKNNSLQSMMTTWTALSGFWSMKLIFFYYMAQQTQASSPECPPVSTAVPNNSKYSVREACSTHMEPIQPPAFTNTHCRSSSGRMWPGYLDQSHLSTAHVKPPIFWPNDLRSWTWCIVTVLLICLC